MKLSLATKFNLVLVFIFTIGYLAAGIVGDYLRRENMRFWLESALLEQSYTSTPSSPPLVNQMKYKPPPQSAPSYTTTEKLDGLPQKLDSFTYKEAILNPTDSRDRASDWQADMGQQLRANASLHEVADERDKVVGAQIIAVPMDVLLKRPDTIFKTFMLSLLAVFAFVFVSLNAMVYFFVTQRIVKLSKLADEVSMGKFDGDDFDVCGHDEVSCLAQSFSRMRTSLARALKMLEETN